jgi:hypothetical protein
VIRIAAGLGALLCGYVVTVRLFDVSKDLYYGTGSWPWFGFSTMKMLVWGAMGTGCVFATLS